MEKVLCLRTCDENLRSYGGFQWPASGEVSAPDWSPEPVCGQGLHGMLWGEGDSSLMDWEGDATWLVVEVEEANVVDLIGKVKFPYCNVVFCGSRLDATSFLCSKLSNPSKVIGCTLTGGDGSTLTGGYRSTLTGGDESTLTGGNRSTLTGGDRSILIFSFWDNHSHQKRRILAYPGENGLLVGKPYQLDIKNQIIAAKEKPCLS